MTYPIPFSEFPCVYYIYTWVLEKICGVWAPYLLPVQDLLSQRGNYLGFHQKDLHTLIVSSVRSHIVSYLIDNLFYNLVVVHTRAMYIPPRCKLVLSSDLHFNITNVTCYDLFTQ